MTKTKPTTNPYEQLLSRLTERGKLELESGLRDIRTKRILKGLENRPLNSFDPPTQEEFDTWRGSK